MERKVIAARRRAILHVSGNMRRNSQKISSSVANTLNTSKSGEEKEKEEEHLLETLLTVPPARAIIDGKVAALGKMQRSLASAVARVHESVDNLVNGDYNRRKHLRGKDLKDGVEDDEDEDDDDRLSEEEIRKREVEKTREAVEQCVNGINEAIELVKSTAGTLNAEHEDDDEEEEGAKAEQKENTYNVGGDDHDEAVSPRRPSSSLERCISEFAIVLRDDAQSNGLSRLERLAKWNAKIPHSPKEAAQAQGVESVAVAR